jgi:hypothetical protein
MADNLLDYYLGPTGIPDRLRHLNELLNPIVAISEAGQDLRRGDYVGALTNTVAAAVPIAGGRVAMKAARGVPSLAPREYDEATSALSETLTGVSAPKPSDVTDMTRRQFMTGVAAAGGTAAMGPDLLELAKKAAPGVARQVNPLQASIRKMSSASKDLKKITEQIFDIRNRYAVAAGLGRRAAGLDRAADEIRELDPLYEQMKALRRAQKEAVNSVEDLAGQDAELFQKYADEIMSDLSAEDGEALIRFQEEVEDDILNDIYTLNAEVYDLGDPGDPYSDLILLKEAEDLTGTVEDGRDRIRLLELLEQSGAPYDNFSLEGILARK